jgi:conserved oligomeric Golgi complex subunit 6
MASYDSSLIIVSGATAVAGTDFRETLDAMIDPLLQICDIGAEKLSDYDRLVYKANCLQYVRVRRKSVGYIYYLQVHDR